MLKLERITKIYHEELFGDITFILGNGEKVGLVGLNGCGKSTLLKIITGEVEATQGTVDLVQEKLGYLPQQFDITEGGKFQFLGEFMESLVGDIYSELWKVEKQLGILDFGEVDEMAEIKSFSPGQKMKMYLTKLLMEEPTILLLDEPTNHLDITGIIWLESFIRKYRGIVMLISHDREFLNSVCTNIFEIDEGRLHIYTGNYNDYVEEKQRRLEERAKQFRLQEGRRQKFEEMIKLIKKQSSGKKQAAKLSSARKRMDREVLATEIDQYQKKQIKNLNIQGTVHSSKGIIRIKDVAFAYPDKPELLHNINLEIFGSETIWLYGPNGTGKSTLLKLLIGQLHPTNGEIKWGHNVRWSYFAQNQTEMDVDLNVQEYFKNQTDVPWERSYGVLQRFMFDKNLRDKRVGDLSPGQKARLTFAIFAQREYECLILDEPTNHLDIETKQSIEHALNEYQGSIILVSHDRYFASELNPDRVMTITEGELQDITY